MRWAAKELGSTGRNLTKPKALERIRFVIQQDAWFVFWKSFPQDNVGNLSQRRPRNISVSSASSNSIEEESGKIIRAAVLGKDGVGKTGEKV